MIAALFCLPSVVALLQTQPFVIPSLGQRLMQLTLWSSTDLHVLGWFGLVVAAIVCLYFYARWSIGREEKAPPPHFLEL